jgi:hypothetical protein
MPSSTVIRSIAPCVEAGMHRLQAITMSMSVADNAPHIDSSISLLHPLSVTKICDHNVFGIAMGNGGA